MADVFESLDLLRQRLMDVRARLPTFPPGTVGNVVFSTGQYYRAAGLDVGFHFDPPLTENIRTRLNDVGRWANEAAVVFLVATLLDHGVFKEGQPHRKDVDVTSTLGSRAISAASSSRKADATSQKSPIIGRTWRR